MARGLFRPKNPDKYIGDPNKIRYLSSWELKFQRFCDENPNILAWASEEIRIKYFNPVKKKVCDYIPDFFVKYRDVNGNIINEMIEIKPKKEAIITKKSSLYDKLSIAVNRSKWAAAEAYCNKAGVVFKVLTEDQLFRK